MRRFALIAWPLALLAMIAVQNAARASVLSSHLTFDGIPDNINDDSRSEYVDVDGSLTLSLGDIAYGYVSVSDFVPTGNASPDELAIVFSATITGSGPTPGFVFTLGPTPAGSPYSLNTLLGLPLVSPVTPAGSIGVVVDLSGTDPLAPEVPDPAGAGALGAPFPGIWEMTIGLGAPGDFFEVFPGAIVPAPAIPRSERGGFSVLAFGVFPSSAIFLPVGVTHLDPLSAPSFHDVTLFSGTIAPNPAGPFGVPPGLSTWGFVDDSSFSVNVAAIPEPASVLVWGLLITFASGRAAARRRRLVA